MVNACRVIKFLKGGNGVFHCTVVFNVLETMMNHKQVWVLVLVFLLSSCVQESYFKAPDYTLPEEGVLYMVPFNNASTRGGADRTVMDIWEGEFRKMHRDWSVKTFGVDAMEKLFGKTYSIFPPTAWHWDSEKIGTLADSLGVDHVLTGIVQEFRYRRGLGEEPIASISMTLWSAKEKREIWSARFSGAAGTNFWNDKTLGEWAARLSREMLQRVWP
jgi:hypothetical protein